MCFILLSLFSSQHLQRRELFARCLKHCTTVALYNLVQNASTADAACQVPLVALHTISLKRFQDSLNGMIQSRIRCLAASAKGHILERMQNLRSKFAYGKRSVIDTIDSVKDVFEKHNVVFTIGASLASAGAAWAGYTARQIHQRKVEDRLNSLEHVMTNVHNLEEKQIKALTQNVGVSYTACAATAGTTLVIGYGMGFRGGRWYALKRFQKRQQQQQKQQQKLLQTATSSSMSGPKKYLETLRLGSAKKT